MIPARASRLSIIVHAVDDTGALCGARPHGGRWVQATILPSISCTRCLLRLGRPRYALCETPTASSMSAYHVRRVGPEGIATGGNGANARTLCELIVGWDIQEVQLSDLKKERRLCSICERIATAPHLAPLRQ